MKIIFILLYLSTIISCESGITLSSSFTKKNDLSAEEEDNAEPNLEHIFNLTTAITNSGFKVSWNSINSNSIKYQYLLCLDTDIKLVSKIDLCQLKKILDFSENITEYNIDNKIADTEYFVNLVIKNKNKTYITKPLAVKTLKAVVKTPKNFQLTKVGSSTSYKINFINTIIGHKVKVYKDDKCINKLTEKVITTTSDSVVLPNLNDGVYNLYAKNINETGTESKCSTDFVNLLIDTVAPNAPSNLTLISPLKTTSNATTIELTVSDVEINQTVKLYLDSACTTEISSSTVSSLPFSMNMSSLVEGTNYIHATTTDASGNKSLCSIANIEYLLDTIPPNNPNILTRYSPLAPTSNITEPSIKVEGSVAGDSVSLYSDSNCNVLISDPAIVPTGFTYKYVQTNLLNAGTYSIYSKITDSAGNSSSCSTASIGYTVLKEIANYKGINAIDVAVVGNYAYLAAGEEGLYIVDITNPTTPVISGHLSTNGYANEVKVQDDYAYLSVQSYGAVIINVANKTAPVYVNRFKTNISYSVHVNNNLLYIASGFNGLYVVDITNKSQLKLKSNFNTTNARFVNVVGDYAYVSDYNSGVYILNVSDSNNIQLISTYDSGLTALENTVVGDYLYIANSTKLEIVNITNKSSPTLEGDIAVSADGVQVVGNYAYVNEGYIGRFKKVNITNKSNPIHVQPYTFSGNSYGLQIFGTLAFVATGSSGLNIFDIGGTNSSIGTLNNITTVIDMVVKDNNYAYLANRNKLKIINITNINNFTDVAELDIGNSIYDITKSGDYVYITALSSGFTIVDVSNPASPIIKSTYSNASLYAYKIEVIANYAYIIDYVSGGMKIFNVTDKTNPILASTYVNPFAKGNLSIYGDYAYLCTSIGLYIVNVSNKANPTYVSTYNAGIDLINDVKIYSNHAYIADDNNGIKILDITNKAAPTLLSSAIMYEAENIIFGAGLVYVSGKISYGTTGVSVFNTQNINNPVLIESYKTHNSPNISINFTNKIYVSEGLYGFKVFSVNTNN